MGVPLSVDELLNSEDLWVCDTGASSHCVRTNVGSTNRRVIKSQTQGMTGAITDSSMIMDIRLTHFNRKGEEGITFKMTDVICNPAFNYNLFSASRCLKDGWTMHGCSDGITMTSPDGQHHIMFDRKVRTKQGMVYAALLHRVDGVEVTSAQVDKLKGNKISLAQAHARLGHCDIEKTRRTAKGLGWVLKDGIMDACPSCAAGKARQKNVPKKTEREMSEKAGERVHHDLSTIMPKGGASCPRPVWHMWQDEASRYRKSAFFKTKDETIDYMCRTLHELKETGKPVKYVRMDNSGENKKFVEVAQSAQWKHVCIWEFSARNTPQENGIIEVGLATIAGRARAMCNAANMPENIRVKLAHEVLSHQTDLDNLSVDKGHTKSRYERFGLKNPKWAHPKLMRIFGEAGVVRRGKNGKLGDRGIPMVFVGYAENHSWDCYRMWNPKTSKITETRDVIWLHRMYYQSDVDDDVAMMPEIKMELSSVPADIVDEVRAATAKREAGGVDPVTDETEVENEFAEIFKKEEDEESQTDSENNEESVKSETREGEDEDSIDTNLTEISELEEEKYVTRYGRVVQPRDFYTDTSMLKEVTAADLRLKQAGRDHDLKSELALIGATGEGFTHTTELHVMNYKQAMSGKDAEEWQVEVDKEHERMVKNEVWEVIPKSEVPPRTKILKSVWAMKPKANGTKRARLNAKGCSQIAGMHYDQDNISSPVTNTASIRIAFTIMLLAGMMGWVVDVNGAFLLGEFKPGDPEIYMEVPEGMEKWYTKYVQPIALKLKKCMYGTKQAARYYYDKVVKVMRAMMYERSTADPCLFYRWDVKYGLSIWLTWIDDKLCIANKGSIKSEKNKLMQHFKCDDVGEVKDYIGCKIDFDEKMRSLKMTQPVLVQSLSDEFEDIPQGKAPLVPAKPGDILTAGDVETLSAEMHTRYRMGVGKLMYLAKHSRPDINNAVRDLARHSHAPNQGHWNAMCYCIRYVRATPERGLVLRPSGEWDGKDRSFQFVIRGRSDSNYATDPETRKSVTGTVVYLNDAPIMFQSVTQKTVTLSVTEAELTACVSCVQDMMYVYRVVTSMGLEVELPMVVEVDNSGARDLANSWSVGGRTRHVDVRLNFLRELKEQGMVVLKHIPGENNEADIFTKNVDASSLHRHVVSMCGEDDLLSRLKGIDTP